MDKDPVLAMLERVAHQMMLIKAEAEVGAEKEKHSKCRKTYVYVVRVRRMDIWLGTSGVSILLQLFMINLEFRLDMLQYMI